MRPLSMGSTAVHRALFGEWPICRRVAYLLNEKALPVLYLTSVAGRPLILRYGMTFKVDHSGSLWL